MIRDSGAPDGRLTEEQMSWLSERGEELRLEAGEILFDETSVIDSFYVVAEGEIRVSRLDGAEETQVATHPIGDWTGQLSILAGKRSVHRARAAIPSRVLEISSENFRGVAAENPGVADVFIYGLGRRMRETQRTLRQQEKLAALGRLSAGLAHELNNPAAAARRAAEEMREAALKAQLLALRHDERFSERGREALAGALTALQRQVSGEEGPSATLDPLDRSDLEDEVTIWLEERGVEDAPYLSPTLVGAGLDAARLEALAGELDGGSLADAASWLGATLELTGLADEVARGAGRVSELVGAMKEYTHMDRAPGGEVDVREGLESAISVLGHKLKGATVERDYEENLPNIRANGGELNQAWMELLDNAADAVADAGGRGWVGVRAFRDGDELAVEVTDDGPGVPREIRGRVFEPFFTTKEVGEGTGLGLDTVRRVVRRQGGEVSLRSAPGETAFVVRLPVDAMDTNGR